MALELTAAVAREQTRARYPDESGYVERDGVKLWYEVYGAGDNTVLLLPTWSIVHSRVWKMQIPYLARHCRVVTFDGRGNGRSDRPADAEAYAETEFATDALAVLEATGTDSATLVSLSRGAQRALLLATDHPERVEAAVFICPAVPIGEPPPGRTASWEDKLDTDEGWAKYNRHYWLRDYRGFLEFFFAQIFSEPHSTKQIEDCVGWGLETDAGTLAATELGERLDEATTRELCARLRCPVLVIQGSEDADRLARPAPGHRRPRGPRREHPSGERPPRERVEAARTSRRARSVPDRRIQRGDDRAHRTLPARARPGGVRRQRGRAPVETDGAARAAALIAELL